MRKITEEEIVKVKKILKQVYEDDQKYRKYAKDMLDTYGPHSKEVEEMILQMQKLDNQNLERVKVIIDEFGWLGEDTIGYKESETLFLVIQHATLSEQLKYFPLMKEAVEKGLARRQDLAMLEDRILVKQGKKQMYGTQLIYDEEQSSYVVEPIVYPEKVDVRREKVGLPPMNESLEYFGLTWENAEFKKR